MTISPIYQYYLVALEVPTIQGISNSQLLHGELVNMLCLEIKAPQTSLKTHLSPITTNPFTVKYRRYWPSSSSLKHNRHFSVFYSLPCAHHEIHLWFSRVQELQRLGAALVPCPLPVFFTSAPCRREVTLEFSAQAKQRLHSPETQPPPQHRHSTFPWQQPFDGPCPGEIDNLPLFSSSSQHTWEAESNQSPPQNGKQRQRQESPNILQKFCYTDRTLYVKIPN